MQRRDAAMLDAEVEAESGECLAKEWRAVVRLDLLWNAVLGEDPLEDRQHMDRSSRWHFCYHGEARALVGDDQEMLAVAQRAVEVGCQAGPRH